MERLRALREAKKMSQLRLGMEIGAAQETISGYEIGRAEPNIETLAKLSKALDTSVDYIIGITDIKSPLRIADLSAQEADLLTIFRKLSSSKKERAFGVIQGLID